MTSEQPATDAGTADDVVMIIRHAEKPEGSVHGVDPHGARDSESLTVTGWSRAGALVTLFAPMTGPVRSGLHRPTRLIASKPGHGSHRPKQTLQPLSQALGVSIDASIHKSDFSAVSKAVHDHQGPTLISWHHEDIPQLVSALGPVTPPPPGHWPGHRFDMVWVLRRAGSGWSFEQVPQLLIAGDTAQPFG